MTPPVCRRRNLFATDETARCQYGHPRHGIGRVTYKGQFRDHHPQRGQEVDGKVGQVVVGVVGAKEEEQDRHAEQELLGRGVLVAIVDLLPHVEIIVGAGVEFERDTPYPVEHKERAEHVADVGEGP